MVQTARLYKLKSWLDSGRCLTLEFLLRELETSPATLKRDRLNAPLEWDKVQRGWRLDRSQTTVGPQFELPGLWFSAEEIHALLTMQHLLAHLDAGGLPQAAEVEVVASAQGPRGGLTGRLRLRFGGQWRGRC